MAKQTSFFASISRLYPHVRPIIPRLVMGLLCALLASVVALTIPQVLRVLVNESLRPGGSADAVWIASLVVLGLGAAEAGLVALRRQFVINPATTVETQMRVHAVEVTVNGIPQGIWPIVEVGGAFYAPMLDLTLFRSGTYAGANITMLLVALIVTVKNIYASQLGPWSRVHYGVVERNLWGVTNHFYRLVLMYAIAFGLWTWFFHGSQYGLEFFAGLSAPISRSSGSFFSTWPFTP